MSNFLGQATGGFNNSLLILTDDRAEQKDFQWTFAATAAPMRPWDDGMLWARARFAGCDGTSTALFGNDSLSSGKYASDIQDIIGGQQAKKIIGNTKDSGGNPLGSCTVQGFVTATDVFVGQCVSDGGGYYELCTSYAGIAHYCVAYRAGSPDVTGATVNTLIPV